MPAIELVSKKLLNLVVYKPVLVKKLALVICMIGLISLSRGQDPQFTQFYANPLYLAPSFAGATTQDRISAVYRNQWPELNNVFVTYSFAYDHFFENFNSGVGVLVMRDVAGSGDLGILNAGVLYSYDIKINDDIHLRPGIHFNYTQQGLDYYKLVWNDQLTSGGSGGGLSSSPRQMPLNPMWILLHRFWAIPTGHGLALLWTTCSGPITDCTTMRLAFP